MIKKFLSCTKLILNIGVEHYLYEIIHMFTNFNISELFIRENSLMPNVAFPSVQSIDNVSVL